MSWFKNPFRRRHHHATHTTSNPTGVGRTGTLRLESCPLHTERSDWAAEAPAQVAAACKRGADVIGFTEVKTYLVPALARIAAKNGYGFYHYGGDVAVAFKMTLSATTSHSSVPGLTNPLVHVVFDFHGQAVEVIALHWLTHHANHLAGRAAQTAALIDAMNASHNSGRVAFYLADSNPSKPATDPTSEPRMSLDAAGLPLAFETVGFPAGIGVTTIGLDSRNTSVKAVKVSTFDALGSDHIPAQVAFKVTRVG